MQTWSERGGAVVMTREESVSQITADIPASGEHRPDFSLPTDPSGAPPLFLIGERERRLYPVDPRNIDYIESDGNYLSLHVGRMEYITRDTLKRLEPMLQPIGFIRIERSLLLNSRAIAYLEPSGRGAFTFTLASGKSVRSSSRCRAAILRTLPLVGARGRSGAPAVR
jgi:DNA-binding LytR/AlgR family response regulator